MPSAPGGPGLVLVTAGLAAGGTLLPFTLFAYAQTRVSAEVAGAFLNLEPLVGAVAGVAVFGDPAGLRQLAGGAAILAGIALSSFPLIVTGRRRPARPAPGRRDRRWRASREQGPAAVPWPAALRGSHGPGARAGGGRRARTWLAPGGTHPRGAAGSGARRPGCPPAQRRSGGLPETRHCCLSSPPRGRAQRPARRCRMGPGPAAPWWHPARRRRARSSHPPPRAPGVAA
jgi:multidrug transporter EmrE-like cation transporter